MNLRSKTWMLALAVALAGCGSNDEPKTPGPAPGGMETASAQPTIDLYDSGELDRYLKGNDVDNPTIEAEPAHRGAEKFLTTVFPIYPRGDVRPEGLASYRIDIDTESFQDGGSLEFHSGKKVLWKQGGVFAPKNRTTTGAIPKTVADGVKAGDAVTWGVYFDNPKVPDVVAEFKVVEKGQVTKAITKFDANRKSGSQSPLVRTLGRAKILQNHSLCSEALVYYLGVIETHPSISEAWKNIVECMRRLDLKKTPLFEEALAQMSSSVGVRRPEPVALVGGPGAGVRPVDPTPGRRLPEEGGAMSGGGIGPTDSGIPPGGMQGPPVPPAMGGDAPAAGPGAGNDSARLFGAALGRAREFGAVAKAAADAAQADVERTRREADAATAAVAAAKRALHDAEVAAQHAGTPADRRAAAEAVLEATRRLAEANDAADQAANLAREAQERADSLRYNSDQAGRLQLEYERLLAAIAGLPPPPPAGTGGKTALALQAAQARKVAEAAAANAMTLRLATVDAQAAVSRARAQLALHPANTFLQRRLADAETALTAAKDAAKAAQDAADQADGAARLAEDAAANAGH